MFPTIVALSFALAASALPANVAHDSKPILTSASLPHTVGTSPDSNPIVTSIPLRRAVGTKKNRTSTWALKQATSLRNKYHIATPLARRQDSTGIGATQLVNVNADTSYYGHALVGTPPKPFNLILDTVRLPAGFDL